MGRLVILSNRNSWRVERADRAAVLIDAASYFGALRKSLIKARSMVFVVGWDLDSRTRLVGESGRADDGYPETFIDLLSALVNERPQLTVHLLVWDYSVLFALERELFRCVGACRGGFGTAWTMICRPARRITRRSSWWMMPSPFPGART